MRKFQALLSNENSSRESSSKKKLKRTSRRAVDGGTQGYRIQSILSSTGEDGHVPHSTFQMECF
jgi:hypothetical protein